MKEIFKKLIVASQEKEFKNIIPRDYKIPLDSKKIVSLIGVRRSGKTFILYDLINHLRQKVDRNNIFYINFEDDRLFPLELKDLDSLIEGYFELYPKKRDEKIYIFLDEIQNINGWEKFVRRLDDTLEASIFITGSSSKLLSREIATTLRGRTIVYEIFPFSFKEYLKYKNIEINLYSFKQISYIKNAFNNYLINGGFAETFDEDEDIAKRILKDYFDLIIYKDLIERYNIKNHTLIKHLIKYLFNNMATLISFYKLYNEYKSLGYKVSKDTIYDYIGYLEDAYTIFTTPIFANSIKAEQRNPKKIFVIDNGFKKLFNTSISEDYSKLYENLAFLHIRRETNQIYYYKGKQEVDIYTDIKGKELINISYAISDKNTLNREVSALKEAMDYFNLNKSYLITKDEEQSIKIDNKIIELIPMWKWLIL